MIKLVGFSSLAHEAAFATDPFSRTVIVLLRYNISASFYELPEDTPAVANQAVMENRYDRPSDGGDGPGFSCLEIIRYRAVCTIGVCGRYERNASS